MATGRKIGDERSFKHGGEGLAEMAAWLMAASCASRARSQLLAAIEVPHGPVVETLIERGFKVHAINPKQMDRFLGDRFHLGGRRYDDSRDAEVMASALRTDPRCFRLLAAADPIIVELQRMAAHRRGSRRRTETASPTRLREQLWRYFPALLELEVATSAPNGCSNLWEAAPTPDATASRLARGDDRQTAQTPSHPSLRRRLRWSTRCAVAPGVRRHRNGRSRERPCRALLVPRSRLLNRQIKDAHSRIDGGLTARLHASRGGRARAEKAA